MNKQLATREILWAAADDWTGLWEAVWSLQTLWPELTGKPAQREARSLLKELVSQGLVYICFFDELTNEERPVTAEEAYDLLDAAKNWQPPSSPQNQVRFAATQAGESELFKLEAAIEASS